MGDQEWLGVSPEQTYVAHLFCNECQYSQIKKIILPSVPAHFPVSEEVKSYFQDDFCTKCGHKNTLINVRPANFELPMNLCCKNEECNKKWIQTFDIWSDEDKGKEPDLEDNVFAIMREDISCPFCGYEIKNLKMKIKTSDGNLNIVFSRG